MRSPWRVLLPLAILALVAGYAYTYRTGSVAQPTSIPAANTAPDDTSGGLPAFLPPEARRTLALIARGGPFPYHQDGGTFGNYEHLLPEQPRGYYHEYTVDTPGSRDRGARRIITGGTPPEVYYYTDDHYRSFRAFRAPR